MNINKFKFTPPLVAAISTGLFSVPFFAEQGLAAETPAVETRPAASPAQPAAQSPATAEQQLALALDFSAAFEKVAADVSPSVVNITATSLIRQRTFWGIQEGTAVGTGSGFIISSDGYILTNNHVVSEAQQLEVRLSDDTKYEAKVIGTDPNTEVALIKIEATGLKPAKLADSNLARPGQWVLAIGSPYNLSQTVTAGIVSAVGRSTHSGNQRGITDYDNFIQTDASVNPGNSGGPLVNLRGEVIGINTAIFSRSGGSVGIGFAVPINLARTVADTIRSTGSASFGTFLGVGFASGRDAQQMNDNGRVAGVPIAEVVADSPAAKAGIQRGDIIQSINNLQTRDSVSLATLVQRIAPGSSVPVVLVRDGKSMTLDVTLAARPSESADAGDVRPSDMSTGTNNPLGLSVRELTPSAARSLNLGRGQKGVQIVEVSQDSPIAGMPIEPNAVVLSINGQATPDVETFNLVAGKAKPSRGVEIQIYSPSRGMMTMSIRNGR